MDDDTLETLTLLSEIASDATALFAKLAPLSDYQRDQLLHSVGIMKDMAFDPHKSNGTH